MSQTNKICLKSKCFLVTLKFIIIFILTFLYIWTGLVISYLIFCFQGAGCTQDGECGRDRACDVESGTCIDPCKGACDKSYCNAKQHKPFCFLITNTTSECKRAVRIIWPGLLPKIPIHRFIILLYLTVIYYHTFLSNLFLISC